MKKNVLIIIALIAILGIGLLVLIGHGNRKENKESDNISKETNNKITITEKDKGYVTTFDTINNKFNQKDPAYKQVDSEDLGVFISFQYIESSKKEYDYYKTHNFLGNEYAKGEVKDYTWNGYSGYTYNVEEKEMSFRILLEDNGENSVVLSAYVGDKHTKDLDLTKDFNSEDFQKFLNSTEFKKITE